MFGYKYHSEVASGVYQVTWFPEMHQEPGTHEMANNVLKVLMCIDKYGESIGFGDFTIRSSTQQRTSKVDQYRDIKPDASYFFHPLTFLSH